MERAADDLVRHRGDGSAGVDGDEDVALAVEVEDRAHVVVEQLQPMLDHLRVGIVEASALGAARESFPRDLVGVARGRPRPRLRSPSAPQARRHVGLAPACGESRRGCTRSRRRTRPSPLRTRRRARLRRERNHRAPTAPRPRYRVRSPLPPAPAAVRRSQRVSRPGARPGPRPACLYRNRAHRAGRVARRHDRTTRRRCSHRRGRRATRGGGWLRCHRGGRPRGRVCSRSPRIGA